jgi:hypothetical protein
MADKEAARKALDPGKKEIVRTVARIMWDRDYRAANPAAPADTKRAAWEQQRADYIKAGREFLTRLEKAGITVTKA